MIGAASLEVYKIVYSITGMNNRSMHYIAVYYAQDPVNFDEFKNIDSNEPETHATNKNRCSQ